MSDKALAVAFGGIITAFSLILMLLTGLFPVAQLALPAMAGVLLIGTVIEFGRAKAALIYGAVALLSLLFAPDKVAAVYYVLFFGHYPILKNLIERLPGRPIRWLAKLFAFNACAILSYFALLIIFSLRDDILKYGYWVALAAANATFIIYDIALTRLVVFYVYRLRKRLKIKPRH